MSYASLDQVVDLFRKIARGEVTIDSWTNGNFFTGYCYPTFHAEGNAVTVFIDAQSVDYIDSVVLANGAHYDGSSNPDPLESLSNADQVLFDWRLAVASQPSSDYEKALVESLRKEVVSWAVYDALVMIGCKPRHGASFITVGWSDDVKSLRIEVELLQPCDFPGDPC